MKQLLSLAAAFGLTLGAAAQTTFNVDMTCAPEGFDNVFVTGPWCGWCANDTIEGTAVVPIPAAAWLFGSAILGLGAVGWKRRSYVA